MRKIIFLSLFISTLTLLVLNSCNNKLSNSNSNDKLYNYAIDNIEILSLINQKCFVCHNPQIGSPNRLAPPMFKVREHYLTNDSILKKDFVKQVVSFALNPSKEKSKMPGAVRNFGLMPKTEFNKKDVQKIASYIFDHDISSNNWYAIWDSTKTKLNTNTN